ncbi:hypothetical protein EJ04DRAFT_87139 [Polyplosphaeria fusca]|uniref:Uncharacterized protein n=1 Tax=Polyplosphaeria fusca TaxID=682080 RepID=A0A9P4V6V7_9PLEO|nr:hypothetical protein EJ04DRAFT_87139 [Polyplosphaeria fusca]
MRSASVALVLSATAVAAQSTQANVTLLNFNRFLLPLSTLTLKGSDSTATTYEHICTGSAGLNITSAATPSGTTAVPSTITSAVSATANARVRRADNATSLCEPFTLIQGPSTYQYHLTDPTPDAWTLDINCNWQGALSTADVTCTDSSNGTLANAATQSAATTTTTLTLKASEITELYQTAVVAAATSAGASSSSSSGIAAGLALPTGGVALVGGAAGLLAAFAL